MFLKVRKHQGGNREMTRGIRFLELRTKGRKSHDTISFFYQLTNIRGISAPILRSKPSRFKNKTVFWADKKYKNMQF